jgi:hypothetical protein
MSTSSSRLGSAALAFALSLAAAPAQAEEGAFQVGLGAWVVSHESADTEIELPAPAGDVEEDSSETRWGLGDHATWLELGYGITDSLIIGGILSMGNTAREVEDAEASEMRVLLGPKLDYMFMPDATVRPFVGAVVALRSVSVEAGDAESSSTGVLLGLRGGVRIFVEDLVSIDPMLGLSFSAESGERDVGPASADTSTTRFGVGLGTALSLWLD